MSFTIIPAAKPVGADALQPGQASLGRNGTLTLRSDDLSKAGIEDNKCILMADEGNLRLGLRQTREGEEAASMSCAGLTTGKGRRSATRRRVNVGRALAAMGLDAKTIAGRYSVTFHTEEPAPPVLIVCLTDPSDRDLKRKGEPRKK